MKFHPKTDQKLFDLCVQRRVEEIQHQPFLKGMQKPKTRELIVARIRANEPLDDGQKNWLLEVLDTKTFPDDERHNQFGNHVLYVQQINAALTEIPLTGGQVFESGKSDPENDEDKPLVQINLSKSKTSIEHGLITLCAIDIVHTALAKCGVHIERASLEKTYRKSKQLF